jgi:RNA polymerase sigma-70 factor, ECF subfamily
VEPLVLALPVATPPRPDVVNLVVRARSGDRGAYAELYGRMQGAVHAVVLARVPRSDVGDVMQDTFVAAWTRLEELRDDAAFPGWVLEIARRRAVDHGRRQKVRAHDELSEERGATRDAPTLEARRALLAIEALPMAYRETLLMRLVEGMSGPEIAVATGLTPESVRVNLCRGMKLLRERLGDEG